MTTMGVTVFCNRVQLSTNDRDQQQLMLLRTLQDNESNIISGRSQNVVPLKNCVVVNSNPMNLAVPNGSNPEPVLAPYVSSRLKKHGKNGQPPPVAVARRNARERNRVKQVNDGFAMLREKIPSHVAAGYGDRGKKLSKVETLRMAVDYIRSLQRLLAEADGVDYDNVSRQIDHHLQTPSPAGSAFSGSTHNGSAEMSSVKDEQAEGKIEDNEYMLQEEELDEDEEEEDGRLKRDVKRENSLIVRLSPNVKSAAPLPSKRRRGSPIEYYSQSIGDEENVEPNDVRNNFCRFSPNSLLPLNNVKSEFRGGQSEELHSRVMSPYGAPTETGSETTNPEEGPTTIVYSSNLEPLSGTLYYKHEISETTEFMDVYSWWEQEQGKLTHHAQPHAQRLTHV